VDLGITQSNIMSYLKKTGEFGPNIDQRIAFVSRLYSEEMHILAGPGIDRVQDLSGKKVNFSDPGSGTQFSTRLIFELLGIRATEVNVGQGDGYQMVKSGEIAATVLIAGKPTGSFGKFKLEPGMKLLPVPYTEALEQDYFPAKLTSEDYPNCSRVSPGRLQLAAQYGPLSARRRVHRCILQQVRRVPEACASPEVERGQSQLDLEGLEALPGRRGVAAQERATGGRDRPGARPSPGRQGRALQPRRAAAAVPAVHGLGKEPAQQVAAYSDCLAAGWSTRHPPKDKSRAGT
jgi:hypothetical protein